MPVTVRGNPEAQRQGRITVPIALPFPPRELNPNRSRSIHWRNRALIAAHYRVECGWGAKAQWHRRKPLTPPVALLVTFVVADNRRRDKDNLIAAFKPGLDGLVDAGVISRDDWQALSVTYDVERGATAHVEVTADAL